VEVIGYSRGKGRGGKKGREWEEREVGGLFLRDGDGNERERKNEGRGRRDEGEGRQRKEKGACRTNKKSFSPKGQSFLNFSFRIIRPQRNNIVQTD